jgi:hypothetical protein
MSLQTQLRHRQPKFAALQNGRRSIGVSDFSSRQMKHYQLIGRIPVSRCQGAAGADAPLARPFNARPRSGKGGQNDRKQGTDGKRGAAYSDPVKTSLGIV